MLSDDLIKLKHKATEACALLKQLANEHRLMLCCVLGADELSVGELNEQVPLSQSALSQHLARLRASGLLQTRREGQTIFYRVADPRVTQLILTLKTLYCED